MKAIVLLSFLLLFSILSSGQSLHQTKKTKLEYLILEKVNALPEVKAFFLHTPKSYKPALMIAGEPNSNSKYYWVKMGISNFDMFRTTKSFVVDPKTFKIRYMDTMCDSGNCIITLQQWRRWRKTSGWNKMHIYKHGKLVVLKD